MVVKRTDPDQIRAYGAAGVQLFDEIEVMLKALVDQTSTVRYEGANAFAFKSRCTADAVSFAGYCSTSMTQLSDAVTTATTAIAESLGGEAITLEPPDVKIAMPDIPADAGVQDIEDGPMIDLRASVQKIFGEIDNCFAENLKNFAALGGDGWIGPEYDSARDSVEELTRKVSDGVADAREKMVESINGQLQATFGHT